MSVRHYLSLSPLRRYCMSMKTVLGNLLTYRTHNNYRVVPNSTTTPCVLAELQRNTFGELGPPESSGQKWLFLGGSDIWFCCSKFRGAFILLVCFQGGIDFACLFSGGLKKCCKKIRGAFFRYPEKSNPPANLPPLTKNVTWDTGCCASVYSPVLVLTLSI